MSKLESVMLRAIVLTIFVLNLAPTASAVVIYAEDFNAASLDQKGAIGNSTPVVSIDMAGVTTFSIDVSSAGLDDDSTDNWFQVRNARFEGQDIGGANATFFTSIVDVSGFSSAVASLDVGVLGDGASVGSESIALAYSLNPSSGTPAFVDFFSASVGNPGLPTNASTGSVDVSGTDEFQIRVVMDVNGADDGWFLDNIQIHAVPEPSAFLYGALVASICYVGSRRRRSASRREDL